MLSARFATRLLRQIVSTAAPLQHSAVRHHYLQSRESDDDAEEGEQWSRWGDSCAEFCAGLWIKAFQNRHTRYRDISSLMENRELWEMAYWRACRSLDAFVPKEPPPAAVAAQLDALREACLSMEYEWAGRGTFLLTPGIIPPVKLPELQDRVVQEVLLMILEPIFEARFSARSFAFRPGRHGLSALRYVKGDFRGCSWFIKGDLSSIIDSFDVELALKFFAEVVHDEVVFKLLRDGLTLKTKETIIPEGYYLSKSRGRQKALAETKFHQLARQPRRPFWLQCFLELAPVEARTKPKWGSCQVLSPLMLNIYLHKLDSFMEEQIAQFTGDSQKMEYVRYAAHFLIGVQGSDEVPIQMDAKLLEFCTTKLKLRLVTETYHLSQGVPFMGHILDSSYDRGFVEEQEAPKTREDERREEARKKREAKQKIKVIASTTHCLEALARLKFVTLPAGKRMQIHSCMRLWKARQEDANLQMSDLLHLISGFYMHALNRKKFTVLMAFVIRTSLATMYTAKHGLKSRAQIYKRGGDDLSRNVKGRRGVFEYGPDKRRIPLRRGIVGIPFRYSNQVPPPIFLPMTINWRPAHERILEKYINGLHPEAAKNVILRYREADYQIRTRLVESVWKIDCCKPVSDILVKCNDT